MALGKDNYGAFTRYSGTIEEVLAEMSRQQATPNRVVWYTDDATDAISIVHGREKP